MGMQHAYEKYKIIIRKYEGREITWKAQAQMGWQTNIKTDLKEIGCENIDWIYPSQATDQDGLF